MSKPAEKCVQGSFKAEMPNGTTPEVSENSSEGGESILNKDVQGRGPRLCHMIIVVYVVSEHCSLRTYSGAFVPRACMHIAQSR